jgi:hypothetical protein
MHRASRDKNRLYTVVLIDCHNPSNSGLSAREYGVAAPSFPHLSKLLHGLVGMQRVADHEGVDARPTKFFMGILVYFHSRIEKIERVFG